ncbi:MAG: amidinotransferase [Actinomycetota bacterium]
MGHAFIELEGHIFDSHLFEKTLQIIRTHGAEYRVLEVRSGRAPEDTSLARIEVAAPDLDALEETLDALRPHGIRLMDPAELHPELRDASAPTGEPEPLSWGRRFLMCPPEFFGVTYEINPWMHKEIVVDRGLAREQWESLRSAVTDAGATVEILDPVDGLPDLVFTANAGLIDGRNFIPASFRHPQRQRETPHATAWFRRQGYNIVPLPSGLVHEGAGDALPFGDVLISGYRMRSDAPSHAAVARIARAQVRAVELVDPRLYHLDLVFCPLDSRHAIVAPLGLDEHGLRVMKDLVPEPIMLTDEEALTFCANSVVIDRTIIMPSCSDRLRRAIEAAGLTIVVVEVSEFLKAGGACRCLTLALDATIGR